MKTYPCNKTTLNRIVDWSSSRYCEWRKPDVITRMLAILNAGDGLMAFSTGSYSPRGHLGGWTWTVNGQERSLTRKPGIDGALESIWRFH